MGTIAELITNFDIPSNEVIVAHNENEQLGTFTAQEILCNADLRNKEIAELFSSIVAINVVIK